MGGEWRVERFARMAFLVRDTVHPSDAPSLPYIGLEHIGESTLQLLGRGAAEDATSLKARFCAGDILFGKLRPYFRKVVRPPFSGICSTDIWVVRPQPVVDSGYLFYLMASDLFVKPIVRASNGTKMPRAQWEYAASLEMPCPPLPEQRAIAHILGTLDDKIELNRRMSKTLEEMARAIFKSWFVDFDPVRAKAAVRREHPDWTNAQVSRAALPTLKPEIAELFPDELVESEMGMIPKGWRVGSFGSFITQRSERVGQREVVVLSAVSSGKLLKSDDHFTKRVYSKETNKYLVVEQWDFAYNPSRINIGSVGMLEEDVLGGVSPVYVVVRPKLAYRWFLWFSLQCVHTKTWINTLASGSVRQSLSYTDFSSIPCVVPPEAVAEEFNQRWSTLREGIRLREAESRTLAVLRDTLLPKLISGEIRLKDAERFLKERGVNG